MKGNLQEVARTTPDLNVLAEDYSWCVDRRGSSLLSRQRVNHDNRYCIWPGQSDDGKKWNPGRDNTEVLPFKGASDCRPHLIDTYIREDVAKLMMIWRRNRITCTPTESNDIELATRLTHLLRWLFYTQMKEAPREARLLANWMLERGQVVACCWWQRQTQMGYQEIDMETVESRAAQFGRFLQAGLMPPGFTNQQLYDAVNAPAAILDPSREDEAVRIFGDYFTDVKKDHARKAVKQLREVGFARFPRPYLVTNRPMVGARAFHEEIFVPPDASDFDTARSVHERELLSEAALRERVISHGWDEEWVNKVVKTQRGNVDDRFTSAASQRWSARTNGITRLQTDKLYEILHSCRRVADDDGVMSIEYTVWHKDCLKDPRKKSTGKGTYAYHGILNYDHGQMPYTLFTSERRSRVIDDARGYGEIGGTWQNLIKGELDQRIDSSSLTTVPPYHYPPGGAPSAWGPAVGIETNRPGDYGWFETPHNNPGSLEIQTSVRAIADQYFGRVIPDGSNALGATAIQQDLADEWMAGWSRVGEQALQLMQQFGSDEIYYRVIGTDKAKTLKTTRDEIQGQFDVSINYNVQLLDSDYLKMFFEMTDKAMSWDVSGRVDRDEMVQIAFELWDPNLAERVMKPGEQAAREEVDDEAKVLSQLSVGIPVDVRPGQAYQMRLNWLQNTLTKNRKLQEQYMADQNFKELLDERIKQLSHQIEQQTVNPAYGKLGGRPAAMGSEAA